MACNLCASLAEVTAAAITALKYICTLVWKLSPQVHTGICKFLHVDGSSTVASNGKVDSIQTRYVCTLLLKCQDMCTRCWLPDG